MDGIATNNPSAVTNKASAIPGATTAKLVFCAMAIAWKLFIIPQTVPNKPIKGATDPDEAKKDKPWFNLESSVAILKSRDV